MSTDSSKIIGFGFPPSRLLGPLKLVDGHLQGSAGKDGTAPRWAIESCLAASYLMPPAAGLWTRRAGQGIVAVAVLSLVAIGPPDWITEGLATALGPLVPAGSEPRPRPIHFDWLIRIAALIALPLSLYFTPRWLPIDAAIELRGQDGVCRCYISLAGLAQLCRQLAPAFADDLADPRVDALMDGRPPSEPPAGD